MSNLFAKLKCSPRREYIHLNDWRKIGHRIKSTSNFTSNYRPLCMVLIFIAEPGIKSSTKCVINWYLKLFYQISRLISLHYLWIRPSKMCRNTSLLSWRYADAPKLWFLFSHILGTFCIFNEMYISIACRLWNMLKMRPNKHFHRLNFSIRNIVYVYLLFYIKEQLKYPNTCFYKNHITPNNFPKLPW